MLRARSRSRSRARVAFARAPVTVNVTEQARPRSRSRRRNAVVEQLLVPAMNNMSIRGKRWRNFRGRRGGNLNQNIGRQNQILENQTNNLERMTNERVNRSGRRENGGMMNVLPLMKRSLPAIGLGAKTVAGCAWLTKALDPAHPAPAVMGIPDRMSINVVCPDFEEVTSISLGYSPAVFPSGKSFDTTMDWNMICLTDFSVGTHYIMCYQGNLLSPTAANFVDLPMTGMNSIAGELGTARIARSRLTYAGITYQFASSDLRNQGRVTAVQCPAEWVDYGVDERTTFPTLRPNTMQDAKTFSTLQRMVWVLGGSTVPEAVGVSRFAQNLMQVSTRGIALPAKEGIYAPVYLNNPSFLFKNHDKANARDGSKALDDRGEHVVFLNPMFCAYDPNYVATGTAKSQGNELRICDPYDCHVVCTHWVGLDPGAVIQLVSRYGIECCPDPGGILSAFAKPSPVHDRSACEVYDTIRLQMDDVYPSNANDLDWLWNIIRTAARAVIPELLGQIPGIGSFVSGWARNVM